MNNLVTALVVFILGLGLFASIDNDRECREAKAALEGGEG